jgi:ABC-type nitrate/sulfonate/bicarbonate transport system substrate-binding protein
MQALRYALSHKKETVDLTRQVTSAKPDDPRPEYVYDDVVRTAAVDPDLPLPMNKIESMQAMLLKAGITPHPVDLKTMVDPSIREKALALVGK